MAIINLFTGNPFGLHITDKYVRAVQVSGSASNPRIVKVSEKELSSGVVTDGHPTNEAELSKAISALLKEAKPSPLKQKQCVVAIPESQCYEHTFYFPIDLEGDDLTNVIELKVAERIPIPFAELKYDYVTYDFEKVRVVFVAAVNKEVVKSYNKILRESCQLKPIMFEPESISLLRNVILEFDQEQGIILVETQEESLRWYSFWKGWIFDSNSIPKKGNADISQILEADIAKSNVFFKERTGQVINKIIVTGKQSEVASLEQCMKEKFVIQVLSADKFRVKAQDLEKIGFNDTAGFNVTCGAALHAFGVANNMNINLS